MKKNFEESVRQNLESFELPFEPRSWKEMEKRLSRSSIADYSWIVALCAACVVAAAGTWTVYSTQFRKTKALASFHEPRSIFASVEIASNNPTYNPSHSEEAINGDQEETTVSSESPSAFSLSTPKKVSTKKIITNVQAEVQNVSESISSNEVDNTESASGTKKTVTSILAVETSIRETCAGNEVEFALNNGPKDGSYLWNFGDGNFSNKSNPTHKYDKPGVYDVSLSVTNKKDGQIATTVMDDFITIFPAPSADFEWDFINGTFDEPTVKIINTSEDATSYEWQFGDGTRTKAISPVRSYADKGKQLVALEVKNDYGCKDSKIKYITINNDYNLMAPEKISLGKELFMPEALKEGKFNFKLTVYNGNKSIFESSQKTKGWDGKLPDGSNALAGQAYPWIVIIYNEKTNEEKYFSGTVTVNP